MTVDALGISQLKISGHDGISSAFKEAQALVKSKGQADASTNPCAPSTGATQANTNAESRGACAVTRNQVSASTKAAAVSVERSPGVVFSQSVERLTAAQQKMDAIVKMAESGRTFSPAELLTLQARVYAASQEIDLAGKIVEKVTGGVKQVLQTQV